MSGGKADNFDVYEPGAFANWIAPPRRGINGQPIDFEYVKFVRSV